MDLDRIDFSGSVPFSGSAPYSGAVQQSLVKGTDGTYTLAGVLVVNGIAVDTWSQPTGLVDPPAPAEKMIIGVVCPATRTSVSGAPFGYLDHVAALGPDHTRILGQYNEPTKQVKTWAAGNWPTAEQLPGGFIAHVRIKDVPDPAWLQPWMDSIPAHITRVWFTGKHEIKPGDESIATYKSRYRIAAACRAASPNAAKIDLVPVFMQYQIDAGMDILQWWPEEGDYLGNDCYSNEAQYDGYRTPGDLLTDTLILARAVNRPAVVAELGAQIDSGKPLQNDVARAKWIRDCFSILDGAKLADGRKAVHGLTWWSSQSTNTTGGVRNDFVLLRPEAAASLEAYRTL